MIKQGLLVSLQYLCLVQVNLIERSSASTQVIGSCTFEPQGSDGNGLCGYQHGQLAGSDEEYFQWKLDSGGGRHYMSVSTEDHVPGQKALLYSPEITQQDTHCFSFQYHTEGGGGNQSGLAGILNVYVLDTESIDMDYPVWHSSAEVENSGWTSVQLALSPNVYKVVFEAYIKYSTPGVIAIDDTRVDNEACASAPHILRFGDKEVNAGQDVRMKCILWGGDVGKDKEENANETVVVMQKANGDEFDAYQRELYDDHLGVFFRLPSITLDDAGSYRCVSKSATEVGVSNFAKVAVKILPVPRKPPELVTRGSTHLKINLNRDYFGGDGPVIQTILSYRPVEGLWADVHEINTDTYHLWHLQPDTEYELKVTLVRFGIGGKGSPGPALTAKTNCGTPLRPVQHVELQPISSSEIQISWQAPDFSITQCHYHSYVIKYREYVPTNNSESVVQYDTKLIAKGNIARIPGLKPFTKYEIKVELTNSEGSVETGDFTILTGEGVPGPIPAESFVVVDTDETFITVQWDEPTVKNGVLTRYEVAFRGLSSFQPDFTPQEEKGLFQIRADEKNVTLDKLHPGTNYTLSIRAQTVAGFGPAVEITASTKIAPPKMGEYPSPSPDDGSTSTPTTIEIELFPAEANGGPISHYYIIIEEVPETTDRDSKVDSDDGKSRGGSRSGKRRRKNKKRQKRSSHLFRLRRETIIRADDNGGPCHSEPLTFEEAKRQNKTYYFGGKLPPEDVTEGSKFTVGEGGSSGGYTNPPLDPNKKYNIYVRVDSNVGDDTKVNCVLVATKASAPPTTTPVPTTLYRSSTTKPGHSETDSEVTTTVYPILPDGGNEAIDDKKKVMMYASIGGGVIGILLLILLIIFIAIRFRRHNKDKQKEEVVNAFEVHMMMSDMSGDNNHSMPRSSDRQALMMPDVLGQNDIEYFDKSGAVGGGNVMGNYGATAIPDVEERQAIRVDDFHIHVNDMKRQSSGGFHDEFASFHEGQTASWEVGKRDENRTKNRYGNIMAYDHSRVVLMHGKGQEEESDYINANYIPGYKNPSMYIAAQAPAAETIDDFWLMVWQEKCSVIVMVTNLVELGKRKCHKYWPEESEAYGSVKVSLTDTEVLCDYTIRTFVIQQSDDYNVREVKQFHFTAWPDHGVPAHPTNILSFVRRVKAYEPSGEGATIVHCSAGSGRTGCFIVIDMMLDMARDEGVVDIYNTVWDMRKRRVNMVQTEEQYIFIHESVLEALLCGDTLVSAPDLRQHYDALITVDQLTQIAPVQEEFETLNVMTPKLTDEECSVARLPRNRARNRFMDVLPADRQMPYLVTPHPMDPESNYINAIFADSHTKSNAFLVTQMPLPNTVIDFWRLVNDYNCTSIIMMNDATEHDQSCCEYWPDNGSAVFGPFTVELLRKEDEVDVVTRLFKLQNINRPSEGYRVVQQFQLTNWPATQPVPYTRNAMLRVIQLVTKWQAECASSGEGRMLVHCVAGAGRSGTFVACYNMCMQLRQEYAVDVFNIVQKLRNVRPQLVETLEQYRFCYEVGWDFADQ